MSAEIADELRKACSGHPHAKIAWPHRLLHRAADALDAKDKRIAELETGGWQPIETAPDLDRVIVAGWQPPNGNVAGYWWMHEDDIIDGVPDEHPTALLWHPFPERPALPAPPSLIDKEDRNG